MQKLKKEKGITIISLVITVIIIIILAGVTIHATIGNDGIITKTREAKSNYELAANEEKTNLNNLEAIIDSQLEAKLTEENIEKIKTKYLGNQTKAALEAIEYTPEIVNTVVTVDAKNNGGVTDQIVTQESVGAIGNNKVIWYLLNVDENNITLVSSLTNQNITFKDSSGYENALYFLNEISTKLFKNESKGVTENNIHAFRLSDIKDAAENYNGSKYDFNQTYIKGTSQHSVGVTNIGDSKTYTNVSYTYHPIMYKTLENSTEVIVNNDLYDEEPGEKIIDDTGISRNETGNPASKLTINGNYCAYYSPDTYRPRMIDNLGAFGKTELVDKVIFDKSGNAYWLASRCVDTGNDYVKYALRIVDTGILGRDSLCYSNKTVKEIRYPFRVIVKVPANHIDVADDGTITIK